MSSMMLAPETIPATSEETFNPAVVPLSLGTLSAISSGAHGALDKSHSPVRKGILALRPAHPSLKIGESRLQGDCESHG